MPDTPNGDEYADLNARLRSLTKAVLDDHRITMEQHQQAMAEINATRSEIRDLIALHRADRMNRKSSD